MAVVLKIINAKAFPGSNPGLSAKKNAAVETYTDQW